MNGTDPRVQADPGSDIDAQLYPGGFYVAMHTFTNPNIELGIIAMRLINVLVFVGVGALLWVALPLRLRRTLAWSWSLTLIPLAAFLIPSTNPTSWAIIGVGMAWLALLGYFEATGWRIYALGAAYLLLVFVATAARSDSTLFVGATSIIALLMTQSDLKTLVQRFALPAVAGLAVIAWLLFKPGQVGIITEGFGERANQAYPDELPWQTGGQATGGFDWALLWYNMWDVPALWLGMFGDYPWGALGWLDTVMPQSVTVLVTWMILGVTFIALQKAWWQKWVAAGLIVFMENTSGETGPVNLGNPGEFTMLELASLVLEMTGSSSVLEHRELPADDPRQRQPNIEKAIKVLGWKPEVALRDGLEKTIAYFAQTIKAS